MKNNKLKDSVRFISDELIPNFNVDDKKRIVSYLLITVLMAGSIFIILSGTAIAADYHVATDGNNINPDTLALTPTSTINIPGESEWKDQGIILEAGDSGSWDVRLNGMLSPCSIIKKDDTYFLYYIGSDGNRGAPHNDGGPRHRKLGVATSTDGINFVKYSGNPIISFSPNNNEEEGIFSAGATLDDSGNIILYYGAMDSGSSSSTSVDGDICLAISNNGYDFTDMKDVLSHSDRSVWGYGDELFPISCFHANNKWYVYYIAIGKNGIKWDIGLAWGSEKDKLSHTSAALVSDDHIISGGNPVIISDDEIALFIGKKGSEPYIEVRTAQINDPNTLSKPLEKYNFNTNDAVVFYDQDIGTWFMYYLRSEDNSIRLKTVNSIPTSTTPTETPITPKITFDNRLREISPNTVLDKTEWIDVGKIKNEKYSGVIWFDLSQYNSTDKIETATLSLLWYYEYREQSTQVSIYRPAEWDPQYVTWNSCADGAQWNNPGGDWYDKNNVAQRAEAYETVVFSQDTAPDGQYHNFDITQLVQSYVDGTYENTGLLIKADKENDGYIAFYSSDWPDVDQRPKLTITYKPGDKTINQAPVLDSIENKKVETGKMIEFEITASDPNGDALTYSVTGLPSGANFNTESHIFSWIPDKGQAGSYHVNFEVADDSLVDTEDVTITVSVSYPPYDVNKNGIVDIPDVISVLENYGATTAEPYPCYDINTDGIVDIKDLDCVASHFGEITT